MCRNVGSQDSCNYDYAGSKSARFQFSYLTDKPVNYVSQLPSQLGWRHRSEAEMEIKAYSILTCVCGMRKSAPDRDILLSEKSARMANMRVFLANEFFINISFFLCKPFN